MKHPSIHPSSTATHPHTGLKAKLALVACALFATASAPAEVFIYRGVDHAKNDIVSGNPYPATLNVYLVVDYAQGQAGQIVFFKDGGMKKFASGNPGPLDVAPAQLPKGHTATCLVLSITSQNAPDDFSHGMFYLRGTDATLTSRTAPSALQANRPRALSGFTVNCYAHLGDGYFTEQRLGYSFHSSLTVQANNANQTVQQAMDVLAQSLEVQGYKHF